MSHTALAARHSSSCLHFSQSLETVRTDRKSSVKPDSGLDCAERGFCPSTFPWDNIHGFHPCLSQSTAQTHQRGAKPCSAQDRSPQQQPSSSPRSAFHAWPDTTAGSFQRGTTRASVQTLRVDDFTLDPSSLCTGTHPASPRELPHHRLCYRSWSPVTCWSKTRFPRAWQLRARAGATTHAHIAISNCSIHFLFISSVLQKNWKPCFP